MRSRTSAMMTGALSQSLSLKLTWKGCSNIHFVAFSKYPAMGASQPVQTVHFGDSDGDGVANSCCASCFVCAETGEEACDAIVVTEGAPEWFLTHTIPERHDRQAMRRKTHSTTLAVNHRSRDSTNYSLRSDATYLQTMSSLGSMSPGSELKTWPASSYKVIMDAMENDPTPLHRFCSRHITFAPSPTGSVHRSEYAVLPYSEIYGCHPQHFDFDARGNMIPSSGTELDAQMDSRKCECDTLKCKCVGKTLLSRQHEIMKDPSKPPGSIIYQK